MLGLKRYLCKVNLDTPYSGKLFLSDLCLQDSCYTCPYRSTSAADLRIGDFWGHEFDRDAMGVSLIVPITEKGLQR